MYFFVGNDIVDQISWQKWVYIEGICIDCTIMVISLAQFSRVSCVCITCSKTQHKPKHISHN